MSLNLREDQNDSPLFDPVDFKRNHPTPTKEEFRLGEDDLKYWALEGTAIRVSFRDNSTCFRETTCAESSIVRSRLGQRLSVASCNPESLSEKEIRLNELKYSTPGR